MVAACGGNIKRAASFGCILGALLLLVAASAAAREYDAEIMVTSPEELYELLFTGELDEASVDTLIALMDRPLDINRADRGLLYDLPDVTYGLADAIIASRVDNGAFVSVDDLLRVPGLTPEILAVIRPFVIADKPAGVDTSLDADVHGTGKAESLWRTGFGKSAAAVDPRYERNPGPQNFLRVDMTGLTSFGGGLLASYRERMSTTYDVSRGVLVSPGPGNQFDLENAYLTAAYGGWNLIAGTFDVGFGERLTFNTSRHRDPKTSYVLNTMADDNTKGRLRWEPALFGVAATYSGLDVGAGWIDATIFASRQALDVYQGSGVVYLPDAYSSDVPGDTRCPPQFTFDAKLRRCASTKVFDDGVPLLDSNGDLVSPFQYMTFQDALQESLAGANLTFNFDERGHVGLTGYQGQAETVLAPPAVTGLSSASTYPLNGRFGAVGVDGRFEEGPLLLSGEYARTNGGGNGAYARVVWMAPPKVQTTFSLRYYDVRFENPRANPETAPDELNGLSARNELGARAEVVVSPRPGLRTVTKLDMWRPLERVIYDTAGQSSFGRLPRAPVNLNASERVSYKVTRSERLTLIAVMANKDLANNGPHQVYTRSGDYFSCFVDTCVKETEPDARGERYTLRASASTSRLAGLVATFTFANAWEGSGRDVFDLEQQLRARATIKAWTGGTLVAAFGYWRYLRGADVTQSREKPAYDGYLDLGQKLSADLTVRLRYGLINYRGSSARYNNYQLAKVALEGRL